MDGAYLLALTTGLVGGFGHCIGMCGPVVAGFTLASRPADAQTAGFNFVPHLLYNTGRIITYTLIGGAMGLAGSFVNVAGKMAGIQNVVALLTGLLMIVMGLNIAGFGRSAAWIEKQNAPVLRSARRFLSSRSQLRFIPLGLILGLLPCGLSYTIFIAAAGTGGPLSGMLTALLFGLGTLPALFVFGAVVSSLSTAMRGAIYRAGGILVIAMGLYFLYRGIRLYADV